MKHSFPLPGFAVYTINMKVNGGREIAQSLASLSTKWAIRVRARLDPLVLEKWNSITVLLTCSHQCRRLVQKRQSMCYQVCVIMHVKNQSKMKVNVVCLMCCLVDANFLPLSLNEIHDSAQNQSSGLQQNLLFFCEEACAKIWHSTQKPVTIFIPTPSSMKIKAAVPIILDLID